MSFATPLVLWGAAIGAIAIATLHFLSVRRPPSFSLPTARFLPDGDARAVSPARRPNDLLLLLLRALALVVAGIAVAGPRVDPSNARLDRFIVVDRAWKTDSAALLAGIRQKASGDNRAVRDHIVWSDTVSPVGRLAGMRADLASAFPLALHAASRHIRSLGDADSMALLVVLPPGGSATTAAWHAWRAGWPGAVEVLDMIPPRSRAARGAAVAVVRVDAVDADDVVAAAYARRGTLTMDARVPRDTTKRRVRIIRRTRMVDLAAAVDEVTVLWPEDGAPSGWRRTNDSVGAVAARGVALVTPMVRRARVTPELLRNARPIAWWSDGEVAALERPVGAGCVREVGISASNSSDLLLDETARGVLDAVAARCGEQQWPISSSLLMAEERRRPRAMAAALRDHAEREVISEPRWLAPVLLLSALALLVAETVVRRRSVDRDASSSRWSSRRDAA